MKRNANLLATFQKLKSLLGGGEKQHKRTLIIALTLIELLLIIGAYISYNNKNLDKYIFGASTSSSDLFAVMIEDSNGNYQESTNSSFPGYEYFYNQTKSGCMSSNGKPIEDSLLYDQDKKKATVKVSETSMCYLYFDKYKEQLLSDKLITMGELYQSNLVGDGYRYVGSGAVDESTNPNNFICFGTTDKSECIAKQDKYMFRIIGVFADENGDNHVKLIKYKSIGRYEWNSTNSKTNWENSDLYKGLNGSYFLTNTSYNYLQNAMWSDKIENWTWSAVNTQTRINTSSNPSYTSSSPKGVYLNEMHKNGSDKLCMNINSTVINCSGGTWTNPVAKIGLLYMSDYALSLGSSALSMSTGPSKITLKTGWIHLSNNDDSENEWTIANHDLWSSNYYSWDVRSDGLMGYNYYTNTESVRPVFYLKSNVAGGIGDGSLENPFLIIDSSNSDESSLKISLSKNKNVLTANFTKGKGALTKYCINNKLSISGCSWKSITSNSINYTMNSDGLYYVHVIDDLGFIIHSSISYETEKYFNDYLINSGKYLNLLENSGLGINDGYRAVGADASVSNFVCFGTTDQATCKTNYQQYLYRVIGVFPDSSGTYHVKLIKFSQLGSISFNSSDEDTLFNYSEIYQGLNGKYFLTSTKFSYLQDTIWLNKIENWTWNSVSTYGNMGGGPDFTVSPLIGIYLTENNIGSDYCLNSDASASIPCSPAAYETYQNKIGLMYASDYVFSAEADLTAPINSNSLVNSWLSPSNTDYKNSGNIINTEWTMIVLGADHNIGGFSSWAINASGNLESVDFTNSNVAFRPVFYLTSDVIVKSGNGSYDNPYILVE